MAVTADTPRNPGPSWGYQFLRTCDRILPEFIFRPLRMAGTWVALAGMPSQRRHSRDYLAAVTGRPVALRAIFRHFFTFEESLMLKLRVANGLAHRGELGATASGFAEILRTGEPALIGTFHFANSDLVGFLLGPQEKRPVYMVRQRVGNSHDTEALVARFGEWLRFIWVNEAANLLFALKNAVDAGGSVALQCDRIEFSSKTEAFFFLNERRIFPFTIYHLALIFDRPVVLCVGMPGRTGETFVHSSPVFRPDRADKNASLQCAREHFQAFLGYLETLLKKNPEFWFNFTALNPVASQP